MTQAVADFQTPTAVFAEAATPSQPAGDLHAVAVLSHGAGAGIFHRLQRFWAGIRWHLARTVFSVPLPLFTIAFDLKLGDLIVTLPICCVCLAYNTYVAAGLLVAESGGLPNLALLIVFALTVRNNSVLLWLTGISFERALLYHKLVAAVAVLLGGLHGLAYYLEDEGIEPAYSNRRRLDGFMGTREQRGVSGAVLFFLMAALLVFSLPPFRRRFYELFLRTHWLLFLAVIVFAAIHGASLGVVGAAIWFADLLFRHAFAYIRRFSAYKATSTAGIASPDRVSAVALPGDIVRIEFPRENASAFRFDAGQYAFLCIPAISALEWHPFTISSSPSDPTVTIHIKVLGDWTRKLMVYVTKHGDAGNNANGAHCKSLSMLIDGCYGHPSVDIKSPAAYSHFVLLGGGIGITPMLSIVNQLHHEYHNDGGRRGVLRRVHLIWAVRDRLMLDAFVDPRVEDQRRVEDGAGSKFFPDRLVCQDVTDRDGVFTADVYLTAPRSPSSPAHEQATGYKDWIESHVRVGSRPDVMNTLRAIGEDAKVKAAQLGKHRGTRVAVLVCGPSALVRAAVTGSMRLSRELGIAFDVHYERFDF